MTITIDRQSDALLIVDVQPDFMPGGPLPIERGDEVVPEITGLLARDLFETVVATQDWHPVGHVSFASSHVSAAPFDTIEVSGHQQVLWPNHCVQGTAGAALHPALPQESISAIIRKGQNPRIDSYSGFRDNHRRGASSAETGLSGYLRTRGVKRVLLCGLALDVCVAWTALDAVAMGFDALLLGDLCRSVTKEGEGRMIEEMSAAGVIIEAGADLVASSR